MWPYEKGEMGFLKREGSREKGGDRREKEWGRTCEWEVGKGGEDRERKKGEGEHMWKSLQCGSRCSRSSRRVLPGERWQLKPK